MALPASDRSAFPPEEDLHRIQNDFLAVLNHEIRTPLTSILGMADLLKETQLNDQQQVFVSATRTCAQELLEHLSCALRFAELGSGQTHLEEAEFNLFEVLEAVISAWRDRALAKGVPLVLTLDPGLPQTAAGDALRIRELLSQVVSNAVKFTSAGEIRVRASAEPAKDGRFRLVLEVRDTGIGIAPDHLPVIFESFRQGDGGLARRYPGLGLGLALVERLLHVMHGDVRVESEPGQGSVVTLTVPLGAVAVEGGPGRTGTHVKRILLADENPVSRRSIAQMLAGRSFDVETVPNADGAVVEAARRRYDLVLIDAHLSGADGFETVRALRSLPGYAGVPVVVLAPSGGEEHLRMCQGRGLQGVIAKPVDANELSVLIGRVLA